MVDLTRISYLAVRPVSGRLICLSRNQWQWFDLSWFLMTGDFGNRYVFVVVVGPVQSVDNQDRCRSEDDWPLRGLWTEGVVTLGECECQGI